MMDDAVTNAICLERTERTKDEIKRINHRIAEVETRQSEMQELLAKIVQTNERMAIMIEAESKKVARSERHIDELRFKPAKHWDMFITAGISAAASALITYFATHT
jgi:tyrosyl-tRNA synthetase